jgi:hypothetical protein
MHVLQASGYIVDRVHLLGIDSHSGFRELEFRRKLYFPLSSWSSMMTLHFDRFRSSDRPEDSLTTAAAAGTSGQQQESLNLSKPNKQPVMLEIGQLLAGNPTSDWNPENMQWKSNENLYGRCLQLPGDEPNLLVEKTLAPPGVMSRQESFICGEQNWVSANFYRNFLHKADRSTQGWRVAFTAGQKIGLFPNVYPEHVEEGDVICILLGCSVPVLCRPQGDYYKIIGDCLILGMMYGETVERLKNGAYQLQDLKFI